MIQNPYTPPDLGALYDLIRDLMPPRVPSLLRVGPHVTGLLRSALPGDARHDTFRTPLGVPVVDDGTYRAGEWRLFDQHGEPLSEGSLWPPDLPVVESDLLPDGVHAVVYNPPAGLEFAPKACVIVRAPEGGDL